MSPALLPQRLRGSGTSANYSGRPLPGSVPQSDRTLLVLQPSISARVQLRLPVPRPSTASDCSGPGLALDLCEHCGIDRDFNTGRSQERVVNQTGFYGSQNTGLVT